MAILPADFDAHAVLARLRAGDEDEIKRAYSMVFGDPIGRFVLAHIVMEAGVGLRRGPGLTADERSYHDGSVDRGLQILDRAGFDEASVATLTMTDQLEGRDDDRSAQPDGRDPDAEPVI